MEQFFQKIKAWYTAHFISHPAKVNKLGGRIQSDRLGWMALDMQISRDTWLRSDGVK